jgi:hypothetical protein
MSDLPDEYKWSFKVALVAQNGGDERKVRAFRSRLVILAYFLRAVFDSQFRPKNGLIFTHTMTTLS